MLPLAILLIAPELISSVVGLVLLAAVGSLTRFYTDLLWFREVDKTSVFWGQLTGKTVEHRDGKLIAVD